MNLRLQRRHVIAAGQGWAAEITWDFLDGDTVISLYLNTETHLWTAYGPSRPIGERISELCALLPPEEVAFAFAAIRRGEYPDEPVWFT